MHFVLVQCLGDEEALVFAKQVAKVRAKKYELVLAPRLLDLQQISKAVSLPLYAQYVDTSHVGAGVVSLDELVPLVAGVLLRPEHGMATMTHIIQSAKHRKVKTILYAYSMLQLRQFLPLQPDMIAYCPPELKQSSCCQIRPELLIEAREVTKAAHVQFLCAAGILSKEDLGLALLLGCDGVILEHLGKDPAMVLEEMLL